MNPLGKRSSIFTAILALILFYFIGHIQSGTLPAFSSIPGFNGPSLAYAEEDEEFEDEEGRKRAMKGKARKPLKKTTRLI